MKKLSMVLLLISVPAFLPAQSEFVVNTWQDSTQRDPQIERDAAGNYVIVWRSLNQIAGSRGDIELQRFNSADVRQGAETQVNTVTANDQDKPALAMNANGDFVVSWASFTDATSLYDVKARIYRANLPLGDEFTVNTTTPSSQTSPDVAIDSAGNFVVVWESWNQDGGDRGVYAQRFSANGVRIGSEFRVNSTTAYSQARPAVAMMRGGKFIVVWESWRQDGPSGYGMVGRVFDATGAPLTAEFQLNTYTNDYQWFGDVDTFDDNSFVVVWCSWRQDGFDGGIIARRFDADGSPTGSEIKVNKTTAYYQWLPKVRKIAGGGFVVVWSSWKQDGSREGVYAQFFDAAGRRTSFETQLNATTASYQWEPEFIVTGQRQVLAAWSSWGQTGRDYEVVARRVTAEFPQTYIVPSSVTRVAGRTTSLIIVHVVDSTQLTGNTYEVSFDTLTGKRALAHVRNVATGDTLVRSFMIDRGENMFYRTPTVQGFSVEIVPELDLELDSTSSYFINRSGSNLITSVSLPTAGTRLIAPIDVELRWGVTDTLPNGRYANPLDTALNVSGQRVVQVPFVGWNRTDNERMTLLVIETSANNRWDAGERIIFLTPLRYRQQSNNTHAQISTFAPGGTMQLPTTGDTNVVLTKRPIMPQDKFRFSTVRANLAGFAERNTLTPFRFELHQNYPNPFNPSTTISFTVPVRDRISLRVYDLLGREVRTLANNEEYQAGTGRVVWDGKDNAGRTAASGVYFYTLRFGNFEKTNKAMLVK